MTNCMQAFVGPALAPHCLSSPLFSQPQISSMPHRSQAGASQPICMQIPVNTTYTRLTKPPTSKLIDEVLSLIANTDRGNRINEKNRSQVNAALKHLSDIGRKNRPLEQPILWGDWQVSYVSVGSRQKRTGQPAGGRFRMGLGRLLFWTIALWQELKRPNKLINGVEFALFGLLRGCVKLTGTFKPIDIWGLPNAIRVMFGRPRLCFGPLQIPFGVKSEATIGITYLDERIRVGKGSKGSWFLFTRPGVMGG